MNEEERKSIQQSGNAPAINNIEEEKTQKSNDSVDTAEQNLESNTQQNESEEDLERKDQSNVLYISQDFNDSHFALQARDINIQMPIDYNLSQEIEEMDKEKDQDSQKETSKSSSDKKESNNCKKSLQSNIILVENRYCTACNLEQPIRAKHCRDCKRCVATHDHHCPWLGTCVGEKNRCHFW